MFTVDDAKSLSQTKASPLFRPDRVKIIEGPTQLTLPRYRFDRKFQVVILDGPHGYPFPDLEYYYFYPNIEAGGLLIIDDIQIPSVGRMFEIIKADAMFDLIEVVSGTAFFRRTEAPTIDPCSDSWRLQGYNKTYLDEVTAPRIEPVLGRILNSVAKLTPQALKNRLPVSLKKRLWKSM